jgi:hypothetical protein
MNGYLTKRQLVIGLSAVVVAIAALTFVNSRKEDSADTPQSFNTYVYDPLTTKRVYVGNLDDVEIFAGSLDTQRKIEQVLYLTASHGGQDKELYTGTVQKNSYSEDLLYRPTGNVRVRQFRVDVEPTKITYLVYLRYYGSTPEIHAICAPQEFQMRKNSECKGVDWH